jgi:hypothetical protein
MDGGGLEIGIYLLLDSDELSRPLQIGDAGGESAITHTVLTASTPGLTTRVWMGGEFFALAASISRMSKSLRLQFGKIVRLHRTCLEPHKERFMLV